MSRKLITIAVVTVTGFAMWVWVAVGRIISDTSVIKPAKRGSLFDWIDMAYNIVDASRRVCAKQRRNQRH